MLGAKKKLALLAHYIEDGRLSMQFLAGTVDAVPAPFCISRRY
jgi:hypothetical protein